MIRIGMKGPLSAAVAAAVVLAGCEDKGGAPSARATGAPAPPSAAADPGNKAAAATGTPVTTTGAPVAKAFDCGGKDQKPCPMQGWMKRVMAPASTGEDGVALAKALTYVAEHAPPGYPDWVTMAKAGAAKAKAGDVDGAKTSCKQCHDAYKDRYKTTMRDQPF